MEEKHGKKRAQIRTDCRRGNGGDIGGLVVWGGALAVAGFIAVFAIIRRRKRGDYATKKKYGKEDSNIGDPPSIAFQQSQCCTRTCESTSICETHIDSCEVTCKSLMVVEEDSTPVITNGNAEYSTNTDQKPLHHLDIKQESTSYDQVENGIQKETVVFDDTRNSEDVSPIISVQQQEQRQEDDEEKEEKEEQQQQADDEGKDVNLGGTESISTESIPERISHAESIDALSLESKKGGLVMKDNVKECDHETNRTDANGTITEKSASRTPLEEGKLKHIVDNYETTHAFSLRRRLWRSLSILVLLAIGLVLFTHLSISVRHLHLDTSLVP